MDPNSEVNKICREETCMSGGINLLLKGKIRAGIFTAIKGAQHLISMIITDTDKLNLKNSVAQVGFEPTTFGLLACCSRNVSFYMVSHV